MLNRLKEETEKLLKNDIFQFNKTRFNYSYFPAHLKSLFDEYNQVLNNRSFWSAFCSIHYPNNPETADDYQIFTQMIIEFSKNILECVDSYYKGKVPLAYSYLQEGLDKNILYPTSKLFQDAIMMYDPESFGAYRIRRRKEKLQDHVGKGQMFHIPFQLRGKVSTQRFSIPGHPSLYLGDSIFVCWKELNEPKINEIYASRFSNNKGLRVIEILHVNEIRKILEVLPSEIPAKYSSELFKYLLMFPLNIACSIKAKNRDANFKPEYIVPQLFLQYVMEHKTDIDGIKYYSTRVDTDRIENVGFSNFVFPSKTCKETGYCDILNAKFCLTEPVLWEHEEINLGNVSFLSGNARKEVNIELIKGRKVSYDWTTFKAIESTLCYPGMILTSVVDPV